MSYDQESLLENLSLFYRLKEQAEAMRKESQLVLTGMRSLLEAANRDDLYARMFAMFRSILPNEMCLVLNPHRREHLICNKASEVEFEGIQWRMDRVLKKALSGKPVAIFNARIQPAWESQLLASHSKVASVLYCPFRIDGYTSLIVFCSSEIGFYTQQHVTIAERYREFTEQTVLSVQAKLQALETEQLKIDKKRAERSMIQSEKMASLGLLAAGVAHEINNPIAFVKSNLAFMGENVPRIRQLLQGIESLRNAPNDDIKSKLKTLLDTLDFAELVHDFEDICSSSIDGIGRVTDIVSSLREFTRDDDIANSAHYDVNKCIENSLRLVSSQLNDEIKIHKELSPLPALRGSQGKLNQVIVNLLVNASHAMSSFGGELTIRSLCRRHPETQKPDCVVLTIEDTGAGIESEDLDKIFAPFYTTKEPGDGTGLGLYISFSIIESLGGTIRVSSEVNVGTRFEIHLPLDAETEML